MTPEILAILIASASRLSGYDIPAMQVEYREHDWFVQVVCGGDWRCKKEGAFLEGDAPTTVFLDEKFEGDTSLVVLSLVLHEAVHAGQYHSGKFKPNDCLAMQFREREAYQIQNQWLMENYVMPVRPIPFGPCQ